jgi:hypothetical protein
MSVLLSVVAIAEADFLVVWMATAGHPRVQSPMSSSPCSRWRWASRPPQSDRLAYKGYSPLFLHARNYAPALPLAITVVVILTGHVLRSRRSCVPD